jgi:integrase
MATKLTDAIVRKAALGVGEDEAYIGDAVVRGLGLRIRKLTTGAVKQWTMRYRDDAGTHRRYILGAADVMNVAAAREMAQDKLHGIRHGTMPHEEHEQRAKAAAAEQARAAQTFKVLGADFLAYQKGEVSPRYFIEAERYITKHWACLDDMPIADIKLEHVATRLDAIKCDCGKPTANRARSMLRSFFVWAMRRGKVASNPVTLSEHYEEASRERVLSMDELATIWAACRDDDYGRIVRLLMLTGQRAREVAGLRWSEISIATATWTLPAERSKNKKAHTIPLSPAAIALLPERREGTDLVFGTGANGFNNFGEAKASLDARLPAMEPWTLHDLRRSCATQLSKVCKVPPHVIEATLNHVSGSKKGVAGIYNRDPYEAEVRAALLAWAELLSPAGDRVVSMRRAG